jgi:hypothetical protein
MEAITSTTDPIIITNASGCNPQKLKTYLKVYTLFAITM